MKPWWEPARSPERLTVEFTRHRIPTDAHALTHAKRKGQQEVLTSLNWKAHTTKGIRCFRMFHRRCNKAQRDGSAAAKHGLPRRTNLGRPRPQHPWHPPSRTTRNQSIREGSSTLKNKKSRGKGGGDTQRKLKCSEGLIKQLEAGHSRTESAADSAAAAA